MRRRLAAVVLLVLALPALALAADTDPKKQFTAADKKKAASLVLKRSDFVAGWKKQPATPGDDEGDYTCPNYNPDQSDLVLTGEAEAEFATAQGFPSVISVANVYRTRREATAAWTRGAKPQLVPCFASALEKALEEDGSKVTVTRKGKLAFPRYAPRTIAYRFSFNITVTRNGQPATVPMTIHLIVLGHGRGDVMLMTFGIGPGVARPDLQSFAKLTAQRLAAAKL